MTKKSKTILFISLLLAFATISPLIILYSQGYRLDFNKFQVVKTGGIYVKVYPDNAQIYIDDKYSQNTAMFSNDLLVQDLLPGLHLIEIKKDTFRTWKKDLLVEAQKVADSKYVILFPEQIPFSAIQENVDNFYTYPNANKFLITTTDNKLISYDSDSSNAIDIIKNPINVSNVYFSATNKNLIIQNTNNLYYLLPLDGKTNIPTQLKSLDSNIKNLYFDSNSDNTIYYQSKNQIYQLDVTKKQPAQLFKKEQVSTFMLINNYIYSLENGNVYKTNVTLNIPERITQTPFNVKINSSYKIALLENELFLIEDDNILYHLNSDNVFEKVLESKDGIKYSVTSGRILFATNNELWLFLTKNTESPFFKNAYSKIFINRFSENITDIAWLNNDYLAYTINNELVISEIDNRNHVNNFEMPNISASKIFFNSNKKLFVLNNSSLVVSNNKLIP